MSDIQSIANGTYVIGETSATNFIAGNGIKIDEPSAGTVRIGNDETVLWSGSWKPGNGSVVTNSAIEISEPMHLMSNYNNDTKPMSSTYMLS